jgi:hypothetical protein
MPWYISTTFQELVCTDSNAHNLMGAIVVLVECDYLEARGSVICERLAGNTL